MGPDDLQQLADPQVSVPLPAASGCVVVVKSHQLFEPMEHALLNDLNKLTVCKSSCQVLGQLKTRDPCLNKFNIHRSEKPNSKPAESRMVTNMS